ncbi:prefoldin subunit [Anaeramoeba flamelloides]|uniref:Prefoldin subunit n=1 Tax=Anaeramoeba flamelloides TaxID=1746091 RepID=A0AAV8A4H1_9EUKA|nr:prefoldin subunit [Anaeramoeba flamelloides]
MSTKKTVNQNIFQVIETQEKQNEEHRGIPKAKFLEKIKTLIKTPQEASVMLKNLETIYSKYKFMENNLLRQQIRVKQKIPKLEENIEMINFLKLKNEKGGSLDTRFKISNNLFVNAEIEKCQNVCLWLGANVMMEYPLDEAEQVILKNLSSAKKTLEILKKDLGFLKDQITTTEVNRSRVYNRHGFTFKIDLNFGILFGSPLDITMTLVQEEKKH